MIVNHRYKELVNKEELIRDYINRENDISAGELYIKKLIVDNGIDSEENFTNKINTYFIQQTFNTYILSYEINGNRFVLTKRPSGQKYYYSINFTAMHPNLSEIIY